MNELIAHWRQTAEAMRRKPLSYEKGYAQALLDAAQALETQLRLKEENQ